MLDLDTNTNRIVSVEYVTRRQKDYERTCRVNSFIDNILDEINCPFIRNNENVSLQKKGVDLVIFRDGQPVSVGEKYAISCWNRPLNTFSFELSSQNNRKKNGWFVSPNNITQDYMLVWLRASDEELRDIYYLDVMFISKKSIKDYLAEKGVIITQILSEFDEKAMFVHKGKNREMKLENGLKVVQSLKFYEAPINILIPKSDLRKLAYYEHKYLRKPASSQKMDVMDLKVA